MIKVPPPLNPSIILLSTEEIVKKVLNRELSCVNVVSSFIKRIKEVNSLINAIAEENYDDAMKKAENIDIEISSAPGNILNAYANKPLLGVPVTIKECFAVSGLNHTCGLYSRRDCRSSNHASVVNLLQDAGAIVVATSVMPELGMWWETYNALKGRCKNPYDTRMITGGSSGGEGALIASGCCPIGLGSDVGGSIRMPAFFNGIFGHKATGGIISNEGHYPATRGELDKYLVCGPLTRSASDLKLLVNILAKPSPHYERLNLNETVDLKQCKFYSFCDNFMRPWVSPIHPQLNAVQENVVAHIEKRYNTNVERIHLKDLPELDKAFHLWVAALERSNGPWFSEIILGKDEIEGLSKASLITEIVKSMIRRKDAHSLPCLSFLAQEAFIKRFIPKSLLQKTIGELQQLKQRFSQLLGTDGVLLFPSNPRFAYKHKRPFLRPLNFVYTAIFNVLEFPVTQCPLGLASTHQISTTNNEKLSKSTNNIKPFVKYNHMPLGIQLISNMYNDRYCLALASELEDAFGGWVPPWT